LNNSGFNLYYFLGFELLNLFRLIETGFYAILFVYFLYLVKIKKKDQEPIAFELGVSLFFLFLWLGSIWEFLCLTIDPIFLHPGAYYFHELVLLPTGFNGEALIYFFGFFGFIFLTYGAEKGSNLPTKGLITLVPASISASLIIFGVLALSMPWFIFAFTALVIPALFFYIAFKAVGLIRKKALYSAFGFLFIFAAKAMNINIWTRNFPELVSFFVDVVLRHPVNYALPLYAIIGCILLIIGQRKYKD